MRAKIVIAFLAVAMLLTAILGLNACSEKQNVAWPNYPLDLSCDFVWNPSQGENEVSINLTVTNNQEKVITQFIVYLYTQTYYDYIKGRPSVDAKQITIYELNLAEGESYTVLVTFNGIFNGLGTAKSVSGNLYGTWVEFDNGQSQWGDPELNIRSEVYANGYKKALKSSNNPNG